MTLHRALSVYRLKVITEALVTHEGNVAASARTLDIQRTYLWRMIRHYGLTDLVSRLRKGRK